MESAQNWQFPVVVTNAEANVFVVVHNTLEAAAYLLEFWPDQQGKAFFEAIRVCADSFDGAVEEEDVRDAFLAAAKDANIAVTVH